MNQSKAFLASQNTLVLATTNPDSTPHATPLFYLVGDDLHLYWFSSLSSQHSKNLKRSPAVEAAVFRPTDDWRRIVGVQLRGNATLVTDTTLRNSLRKLYAEHFDLNIAVRAVMARCSLFVLRPCWIRYIDNTKRFGYKFEISL